MDNQQALTGIEQGWLCGFFDGEGYVGMNVMGNYSAMNSKTTKRKTIIVPRLVASNTDYATTMKFVSLMQKGGVGVHVQKGVRGNPKHAPVYRATINGHKRCLKAIPILLAGCITKKSSLELMLTWLKHRDAEYHYSLKDYELYQEFMKRSGKGSNDSTLRRLYDSCTSELNYSDGAKKAWESRRKIESTH